MSKTLSYLSPSMQLIAKLKFLLKIYINKAFSFKFSMTCKMSMDHCLKVEKSMTNSCCLQWSIQYTLINHINLEHIKKDDRR